MRGHVYTLSRVGDHLHGSPLQAIGVARVVLLNDLNIRPAAKVFDSVLVNARPHSALSFLRPVDYYQGDPETLLAERRRKLPAARELRKQENIKLRQRLLPFVEDRTVSYSEGDCLTLIETNHKLWGIGDRTLISGSWRK